MATTTAAKRTPAAKKKAEPVKVTRDDVTVEPPLSRGRQGVRLRDVIGDRRADALERRAEAWARENGVADWPPSALRAYRELLGNAFEHLDRGEARAVVRVEAQAAALEREAAATTERLGELDGSAKTNASNSATVKRVKASQLRSSTDGNELDRWMHDLAEPAAQLVAVQLEQDIKHEIEVEQAYREVLAEAPEHVADLIGQRPSDGVAREKWDWLAKQLVRAEVEERADELNPEVARRIDLYRGEMEMPPREQAEPAVEVDVPVVEMAGP